MWIYLGSSARLSWEQQQSQEEEEDAQIYAPNLL